VKVPCLAAGMAAGADSIDDMALLRHGAMPVLFGGIRAPSTLGSFLGIGSYWPFDQWDRFLPEHTTAVSLLDRLLHHAVVVVTEGESFRMPQARTKTGGRLTKN
jgi:DNA replication protein DnaC